MWLSVIDCPRETRRVPAALFLLDFPQLALTYRTFSPESQVEVQIFNTPCLPQVDADHKGDYENDIPAALRLLHGQKVRIRVLFCLFWGGGPLKFLHNA